MHLYNSEGSLLTQIGPNPAECRQVWIKDMTEGVYYHNLAVKLANSKRSMFSKRMKIECGRASSLPILQCNYVDEPNRQQLTDMAYHLINIRDK